MRIVIAEDSVLLRAGLTRILIDAGEEVVATVGDADELLIAFNPGYLSDGLSAIHTDRVVMGFTQPSRPAVLIPEPDELPGADEDGMFPTPETEFTYLLMPVRLPG